MYLSIYLSSYLSISSVYLTMYLPIYVSTYLSISLSVCLSICKLENEAILRDVVQKSKVECRVDGLVPMRFAIFPVHLSKLLRLPGKSDARSYEVLHLSRKIISANLKIWCSKMQPLSGNQRPDLLTALMNMSLVLRLPRKMHLYRFSSNAPRLPSLEMLQNPHVLLTFDKVHNPLHLPYETTSENPKVARTCSVFNMLASKCASHHISISKSGPSMECFVHFDFEMCFALQRRALFRHLNFQKWSDHGVFCTFWLRNVLRATTPCTFSASQLAKVVRPWCVLYILTSKCASRHNGVHFCDISTSKSVRMRGVFCFFTCKCTSRHNGVQFFISHLASWLRTRGFSKPAFRPSFHLSILSEVWLLNFIRLQHFLHLLSRFFALTNAKKRWYLRGFQKIEDRDVNETL